jgi:hypothetical protein
LDSVEIIWLLGLAAWALVSRLARSRRRPPAEEPVAPPRPLRPASVPEPSPAGDGPPSPPQNLRELWQEIRRGIQEAAAPAESVPEPVVRYRTEASHPEPEPEPIYELPPPPRVASVPTGPRRRRSALAQGLIDDLSSGPSSLARAMLLREVLGPPVALRNQGSKSLRG